MASDDQRLEMSRDTPSDSIAASSYACRSKAPTRHKSGGLLSAEDSADKSGDGATGPWVDQKAGRDVHSVAATASDREVLGTHAGRMELELQSSRR